MKCNIWNAEKKALPELLDFIVDNRGKTVPTSESGIKLIATNCILNSSLYPVYENIRYVSEETYNNWFRAHPETGDIIFVNKGTPGKVCMVPSKIDFCFAQDMIAFRTKKEVYNKYLFAVLRSSRIQKQIENSTVGTLIPHFKKEQLKDIYIPIPEYDIQKKIGDLYFKICEKIDINNKICDNLQKIIKLQYLKLINMEEGVEDKLGNYIIRNKTKIKNKEEWENLKILDLSVMPKYNLCVKEYSDGHNFGSNIYALNEYDLLYGSIRPYFGKCCFAPYSGGYAGTVYNFLPINKDFYSFILGVVSSNEFINYTVALSKGTKMPVIGWNDIMEFKMKVPNNSSIISFNEHMMPIVKRIKENYKLNESFSYLRDTLLPKVMKGEIELDNIDI